MLDAEPAQHEETKNYRRFTLRMKREKKQLRFDNYIFDKKHFARETLVAYREAQST